MTRASAWSTCGDSTALGGQLGQLGQPSGHLVREQSNSGSGRQDVSCLPHTGSRLQLLCLPLSPGWMPAAGCKY